ERLLEADLHVVAQVGAALAAAAAPAPGAAAHAEQVVEDVGEGRGDVAEAAGCAGAAVLEGGMAEAVVGGALVGILEDLVGLVDLLEAGLARLVAGIAVGVPLHGELTERGLELGVGGGALDFQDLVVAALGHPRVSPRPGGVVEPYMVIHGASKRLLERHPTPSSPGLSRRPRLAGLGALQSGWHQTSGLPEVCIIKRRKSGKPDLR